MTKAPMVVHCDDCGHEWAPCFLPASVAVATRCMAQPCPACGSSRVCLGAVVRKTANEDAIGWLTNGDTGISSLTIWSVMMDRSCRWAGVPYDADDFGRCYRLLRIMPSWRARLPEVVQRYPDWRRLVERWDEVTALYELELPSGQAPQCSALISELVGDVA